MNVEHWLIDASTYIGFIVNRTGEVYLQLEVTVRDLPVLKVNPETVAIGTEAESARRVSIEWVWRASEQGAIDLTKPRAAIAARHVSWKQPTGEHFT